MRVRRLHPRNPLNMNFFFVVRSMKAKCIKLFDQAHKRFSDSQELTGIHRPRPRDNPCPKVRNAKAWRRFAWRFSNHALNSPGKDWTTPLSGPTGPFHSGHARRILVVWSTDLRLLTHNSLNFKTLENASGDGITTWGASNAADSRRVNLACLSPNETTS